MRLDQLTDDQLGAVREFAQHYGLTEEQALVALNLPDDKILPYIGMYTTKTAEQLLHMMAHRLD
jgi:hypothetical protein